MSVEHFIENLVDGALVIVPGDRPDILVATLASTRLADDPTVSRRRADGRGTSSARPPRGCSAARRSPSSKVPQLTHVAAPRCRRSGRSCAPRTSATIASALGLFEASVDTGELERRIAVERPPARDADHVRVRADRAGARRRNATSCCPRATTTAILRAADILLRRGVARLTILGEPDGVRARPPRSASTSRARRSSTRSRSPLPRRVRRAVLRAAQAQGHDRGAGRSTRWPTRTTSGR